MPIFSYFYRIFLSFEARKMVLVPFESLEFELLDGIKTIFLAFNHQKLGQKQQI